MDEPPVKRKSIAERAIEFVMAALLVAMLVMVFANVVVRYGFHSSFREAIELSRLGFVWISMIGAVLALWNHEHLGVPEFIDSVAPRAKPALWVAGRVTIAVLMLMLAYGSWHQTEENWVDVSQITGLPTALFYLSGVVGGALMALIAIVQIFKPAPRDLHTETHIE